MITVKIKGGLGNQMFQYAFGRALALQYDTDLALDKSWFASSMGTPRSYTLDKFKISVIDYNTPAPTRMEKHYGYDTDLLLPFEGNMMFSGYFQSEGYFKSYRNVILEDFALRHDCLTNEVLAYERMIQGRISIFIHIRRGDRTSGLTLKTDGLVSKDFYLKGIKMMKHWFPDSQIVIFAEDRGWVENNLKGLFDIMIDKDTITDYQSMYLMTKCDHAIIPNSSFSWWGAWLMQNPHKIVIAPTRWTVDPNHSNIMIVPQGWIKINPEF